jgi:stage V sporulation protein R
MYNESFPTELKIWKYEIERLAGQFGLSLPPIVYTLVSMDEMSEIIAYHGFPTIPHHWRYGQESIISKKQHKYGLGRVYELVVGTRPMYGYLMDSNHSSDQKAVMAHVCGHGDMFKNNVFNTLMNPDMMNIFANDAMRYEEHCLLYEEETVKKFYDWVLSLELLIDQNALLIRREPKPLSEEKRKKKLEERSQVRRIEPREELPFYMDDFLNPEEWIEEQREKTKSLLDEEAKIERGTKVPAKPMKDVLLFLVRHAHLQDWQRDIILMVRRHLYYHTGIMRTKFMHEGWSALWEERILNEPHMLMGKCDLSVFAEHMAMVQHKSPMNPYKLAYDLWKDIEYRWNTGRHGEIWEKCDIQDIRANWDEFIVFKNILCENSEDNKFLQIKWQEFLAFKNALKEGKLGYPKEFFVRNFFTSEILIPAWVDYKHAEERCYRFKEMLKNIERFEEDMDDLMEEIKRESDKKSVLTEEEIRFEARRTLYYTHPDREELYFWTIPEVKRQITYYEKLLAFRENFTSGKVNIPHFHVPETWFSYADRFPGGIEIGIGIRKMFEVREYCDDWMFMDEFFTKEFCEANKYFLVKQKSVWDWRQYPASEQKHWVFETRAFERILAQLLFRFTNFNSPIITIEDGNLNDNNELLLLHHHNGVDLDWWSKDEMYVKDVLENLFKIWGSEKDVHIETIKTERPQDRPWWFSWYENQETQGGDPQELNGKRVRFTFGKRGFRETNLGSVQYKSPF